MSISTIIIGVVIFVVLGIFLKYKTGKKKLPSDRSNAEKLANTLHTKFDKFMKDLNNGIRTPEFIQEEMLMTLDDFKFQKLQSVKQTATNMVTNMDKIKANRGNLEKQKNIYESKVNESKSAVNRTSDDVEKYDIIMQGAHALQQVDILNKSMTQTDEAIKNMQSQLDKIHNYTTSFISKIEMKKTEILTMISTFIASDNSSDFGIDITIDDLMNDYRTQMDVKVEHNKIDAIAHSYVEPTEEAPAEDYIAKFKEQIA